jgi:ABC-type antimicrobial peptide transport system permease subunit
MHRTRLGWTRQTNQPQPLKMRIPRLSFNRMIRPLTASLYAVSKRTRDIGIRIAIGAQPRQVLRSVLGRTVMLLSIGSSLGLALGLAAGKVLSSIVYEASARDPLVLVAVALTMAAIGRGAALAPARQALSIDPIRSLRQE